MTGSLRELRRRRANVARRLVAGAPALANHLEWHDLDAAPGWLAASDEQLARFCCRVGALACAPAIRLWIDKPRIAATREAVGLEYLQRLLASHEAQAPLPGDLFDGPLMNRAEQITPALRANGCAVLLATLPEGPLRAAMTALWSPVQPSELAPVLAQMMVERAAGLAAEARPAEPSSASSSTEPAAEPR